jgi:branched-subunit amino acid transport protein
MNGTDAFITIAGLTAITVVTRAFFLFSDRELVLPGWVNRGLRYAPLAALAAVVVPEVVMSFGQLIDIWQDARLYAVAASTAYYFWGCGILGTIVSGVPVPVPVPVLVLVPLKLGLGW